MIDQIIEGRSLVKTAEHYVRTNAELYKLKAIDKTADGISNLFGRIVIIPFALLFFIILNLAIAFWIGELLEKTSYGFFILAGFYAFIAVLLYIFGNRWIKAPIRNAIIKYALKLELPWKNRKPHDN
jgi:hypothetical protein